MKKIALLVGKAPQELRHESTFFNRNEWDLQRVDTGKEALEAGDQTNPSVVLVDYELPDIRGDVLCLQIRGKEWGEMLPILFFMASEDQDTISACFEAGCSDYVSSESTLPEILSKVATILAITHRIHYRVIVDFEVEGRSDDESQPFIGFSRNISAGGILLEALVEQKPGTVINMALPILPRGEQVEFKGRVKRAVAEEGAESCSLGIEFIDLSDDLESTLTRFIEDRGKPPRRRLNYGSEEVEKNLDSDQLEESRP